VKLIVVHQLFIASAVALAVIFGVRAMVHAGRGEGSGEAVIGVASLAVGAALALYLRNVRARYLADERAGRPTSGANDGR